MTIDYNDYTICNVSGKYVSIKKSRSDIAIIGKAMIDHNCLELLGLHLLSYIVFLCYYIITKPIHQLQFCEMIRAINS